MEFFENTYFNIVDIIIISIILISVLLLHLEVLLKKRLALYLGFLH
jgi:hypothetical protein